MNVNIGKIHCGKHFIPENNITHPFSGFFSPSPQKAKVAIRFLHIGLCFDQSLGYLAGWVK